MVFLIHNLIFVIDLINADKHCLSCLFNIHISHSFWSKKHLTRPLGRISAKIVRRGREEHLLGRTHVHRDHSVPGPGLEALTRAGSLRNARRVEALPTHGHVLVCTTNHLEGFLRGYALAEATLAEAVHAHRTRNRSLNWLDSIY